MKKIAFLAVLLLATPLLAQPGPRGGQGNGPGAGSTAPAAPAAKPFTTYFASLPQETLSSAEAAEVSFMREEEKLSRDVYRALFAAHGDRVFASIAAAEQRHMDLVKLLLDRYGLVDPAATAAPGEFMDARLAALYTDLVAKGKVSLLEALKVGATIEDLDLADLAKALAASDNRDVDAVMQNLAKGSRNHLRAFVGRLAALGAPFSAQYLPADDVAAILAAPRERGAVDETGKLLPGTGAGPGRMGLGRGRGPGAGSSTGTCDGTGPGTGTGPGAGFGPGDGTGAGCPNL
ncbi:hypothetical protein GPROT1_00646 [Gammaproteobacteria bacterium]|nr:hypothetical protein GPROT1_00646 [Gammaproteobacteria bacterium]